MNSLSKTINPSRPPIYRTRSGLSPKKPINTNAKPTLSKNVNNYNNAASKTLSGDHPRQSVATRIEYEQLIDVMQNALMSNNKTDCSYLFLSYNKIILSFTSFHSCL